MIPFPLVFPQTILLSILSSPLRLSVKATKHPLSNLGFKVGQFQGHASFSPISVHVIILREIRHSCTQSLSTSRQGPSSSVPTLQSRHSHSLEILTELLTEEVRRHQEVGRRLNLRPGSQEQRSH